jgi:hypothetical protein
MTDVHGRSQNRYQDLYLLMSFVSRHGECEMIWQEIPILDDKKDTRDGVQDRKYAGDAFDGMRMVSGN